MSNEETRPGPANNKPAADDDVSQRPLVLRAAELLQGRREVWIEHEGEMYRLRLTAKGKLYLSK